MTYRSLVISSNWIHVVQSEWTLLDRQLASMAEKGLTSTITYGVNACNYMIPIITSYLQRYLVL